MSLYVTHKEKVEDLLHVCKWLSDRHFATSHGGNLAYKMEDNVYLITPTRRYKNSLVAEDLVFVDIDGNTLEGTRKPSGEMPMYLNMFKHRPDIVSAIHCHPPWTNAFTLMKENWLMRPLFPESVVEIGPVPVVPYGEPISQELADNFVPFLQKYNTFIMENHGITAISPSDIIRLMHIVDMLEVSSISILAALAAGEIKEIPRHEVEKMEKTIITRELPMIGAPGANTGLIDLFYPE